MARYLLRRSEVTVLDAIPREGEIAPSALAVEAALPLRTVGQAVATLADRGLVTVSEAGVSLTTDGLDAVRLTAPNRGLRTTSLASPEAIVVIDDRTADVAASISDDDLDARLDAEIGWPDSGAADNLAERNVRAQP